MKAKILIALMLGTSAATMAQNVGIGSTTFTPATSSLLELRSTTSGFLMPRMTEAQKNAITSPTEGLMIYQNNNTKGFQYWNGTAWTTFGGAADNFGDHIADMNIQLDDHWLSNDGGNEGIRIGNDGNVGIGIAIPTEKFHVNGAILFNQDIYSASGNARFSGEDDVYITMDHNNDDANSRAIRFGKNSMSSPTELMRISETGNVGIGTVTPYAKLNVGDAAGGTIYLTREDNSTMNGDVLGTLLFDSTDDTAPSSTDASAGIRAYASKTMVTAIRELTFLFSPRTTYRELREQAKGCE